MLMFELFLLDNKIEWRTNVPKFPASQMFRIVSDDFRKTLNLFSIVVSNVV